MGRVISIKSKRFIEDLNMIKILLANGKLDTVLVIATGEDLKCSMANGLMFSQAREMCKDFMDNPEEYVD